VYISSFFRNFKKIIMRSKALILLEINATCTKSYGRSAVSVLSIFEHIHILDGMKDISELESVGMVIIREGLIYKA
jgi:hypothetical protein